MKKSMLVLFLFVFVFSFGQEKKCSANYLNSTSVDADSFFGYDQFGFYYYTKNNVLFKKNKSQLFEYKNVSLGKITKIDFQNPLKVLLFYQDFNAVVLLDNQLVEVQKINFSFVETPIMVTAVGIASGNRIWIYNSLSQQIGLYDYLKNSFLVLGTSFQEEFKHYYSDFNTFQWIDDKLNWFSCDVFGKISNLGKVPDFNQIQFGSNQQLLFAKDHTFYFADWSKNSICSFENVNNSFVNFVFKDQILSIFTNQEIINYKIIKP